VTACNYVMPVRLTLSICLWSELFDRSPDLRGTHPRQGSRHEDNPLLLPELLTHTEILRVFRPPSYPPVARRASRERLLSAVISR
jgi:hypothetical protein